MDTALVAPGVTQLAPAQPHCEVYFNGNEWLPAARDFDSITRTLLSNAQSDGGDSKIENDPEVSGVAKGTAANPVQPTPSEP